MNQSKRPNPKRALISGALWSVGNRWTIKVMGLVSTIIVARLLLPADYGIVAMSMLVVGLIQAMLDFGAATALLRKGTVTSAEINSAWTLRVLEGSAVGLLLLAAASPSAHYFSEPRVEAVLWALAACTTIHSASNIGLTLAQKDFNFSLEFRHNLICKFTGVLATITAAHVLRDYRALVIGVVTGYTTECIMSYVMHPYRPRWNTTKIADIWAVTKWLMLAGVGGFILRKSDELVAARIGSTAEFGLYNVASSVGQLPTGELGPGILRAFLPVLSSIQDDITRTNQAVLKTLAATNTLTLPVGLGFAAIATPATAVLLGEHWLGAAPLVAIFAVAGALQFALTPLGTLLVLRGHTRVQSQIVWIEFAAFSAVALLLVPQLHLIGLVWARIAGSLVNGALTAGYTQQLCRLPMRVVGKALARPLIGALGMFALVSLVVAQFATQTAQLAFGISAGILVFGCWSALTWLLAGRPEGLESTVFDWFARRSYRQRHGN